MEPPCLGNRGYPKSGRLLLHGQCRSGSRTSRPSGGAPGFAGVHPRLKGLPRCAHAATGARRSPVAAKAGLAGPVGRYSGSQ